jgi:hypothetical protein
LNRTEKSEHQNAGSSDLPLRISHVDSF